MKLLARGEIHLRATGSIGPVKLSEGFGEIGIPTGSGTARFMPYCELPSPRVSVVAGVDPYRSPASLVGHRWLTAATAPAHRGTLPSSTREGPVSRAYRTVTPSAGVVQMHISVGNASAMVDLEERA